MVKLLPVTVWTGNQVQMLFPNNDAIFQDYNSPHMHTHTHTARSIQSWSEEHEDALQHPSQPKQWPDLNITETLWSVLEWVRSN
jgi:hypothetical protein